MSASSVLRAALATALPAVLLAAAPAVANVPNSTLLSHTAAGQVPNAPAAEAVMSGDGRQARFAAYTSKATNIVGSSGGNRNVFLVKRRKPYGLSGTRWHEADTRLATRGRRGTANGDSWSPSFDGFDDVHATYAPKCLAFVSKASNLVSGDSNGRTADVFIRRLSTGKIKRLRGSGGATEVALDGQCKDVAYVARGKAFVAQTNGRGRARRASGSGARTLVLSANGETLTYERGGNVFVWVAGKGARRLGPGAHPSSEEWGRYVTFERGGTIFKGNLKGGFSPRAVAQTGGGTARGSAPNMSAGGGFVAYVVGSLLSINGYNVPKGSCMPEQLNSVLGKHTNDIVELLERTGVKLPAGTLPKAVEPRMSAHGNYLVYSCEGGPAWLTYIGDFATGSPA